MDADCTFISAPSESTNFPSTILLISVFVFETSLPEIEVIVFSTVVIELETVFLISIKKSTSAFNNASRSSSSLSLVISVPSIIFNKLII